ncbi:MAG: HAMP domain-containing sensor histidine kinase [Candidatus Promineifilaceae bacterium]
MNSLRNRLLLSYLVIIATILVIVAVALLAVSVTEAARILPTLRQLSTIGISTRRELNQLLEQGTRLSGLGLTLSEAAETYDVRILVVDAGNGRILYDSAGQPEGWGRVDLAQIVQPRGDFSTTDANLPAGRYHAPDGTRWLIVSQAVPIPGISGQGNGQGNGQGSNRALLIFARPEPRVLQVFRDTFLRPLFQAGVVAVLLSLLLAVLISRSVARPLQTVASAAESIAQGDYDQQIPVQGPDEVRRVASSFNTMSAEVAASREAQRDFVANVSHDLKTPLTSVTGWSQALMDGTADKTEQRERAVRIIHDEAGRMSRMVEQLLDLAKIESGQLQLNREPVNLAQLIREVQRNLILRAEEKEVHLTMEIAPVSAVSGDRDRLVQILTNLVDNAIDHTPPAGQVTIGLKPYDEQMVELVVQDTGPGISPEDLSRIFERFYQVDKSRRRTSERQGVGLGLAIVKELVEAHDGRITVQSDMGQGSSFVVRLPVAVVGGE